MGGGDHFIWACLRFELKLLILILMDTIFHKLILILNQSWKVRCPVICKIQSSQFFARAMFLFGKNFNRFFLNLLVRYEHK